MLDTRNCLPVGFSWFITLVEISISTFSTWIYLMLAYFTGTASWIQTSSTYFLESISCWGALVKLYSLITLLECDKSTLNKLNTSKCRSKIFEVAVCSTKINNNFYVLEVAIRLHLASLSKMDYLIDFIRIEAKIWIFFPQEHKLMKYIKKLAPTTKILGI